MFRKMTDIFGYSVRQLAQKVGKDKGYIENRLRLAEAPPDIRELVSLRRDTLSHAYELLKIDDEPKRRRLAKRVAAGELSLARLRSLTGADQPPTAEADDAPKRRAKTTAGHVAAAKAADDAILDAKGKLADAVEELVDLLRQREVMDQIGDINRDNFAKYLTITKLKIENAIAIIRASAGPQEA
jgi:hypothetical protein